MKRGKISGEPYEVNKNAEVWFTITVWDRDTNEEWDSDVSKDWLTDYGVDIDDFEEVMEFIEEYWAERNCCVISDFDEEDW